VIATELLLALAAAAVLLFWAVGAYNRLVAWRNRIAQAWAKLHSSLHQRAGVVQPLAAVLRVPMAAEHGALEAWLTAHTQAQAAATALAARPVSPTLAQAWVVAEAQLAASTSRVLALLDQHSALRGHPVVTTLTTTWHGAQARLPFAREAFNDVARRYNDALAVFPTSLAARLFGFSAAGLL
jgi:LemA protein